MLVVVVSLVTTGFDGNEKLKLGAVPLEEVVTLKLLFTAALKASNPVLPDGGRENPNPVVDDPAEAFETGAGGGKPNPTGPVVVDGVICEVFCANPNPLLLAGATGAGKANPNPLGIVVVAVALEGVLFANPNPLVVVVLAIDGLENPNPLTLFVANRVEENPIPEGADVDGTKELFTGVANPNPFVGAAEMRILFLLKVVAVFLDYCHYLFFRMSQISQPANQTF